MEVERVQAIASSLRAATVDDIPPEFVRSEHEQPGITTYRGAAVPEVPVIDLGSGESEAVVGAVAAAAREWGIFQLVNHGIPAEVVAELRRVGQEFFELPQEEKERYAAPPEHGKLEGYGTRLQRDLEGKKSWVDFLFHNVWPPASINYAVWPKTPADYRKANEEYTKYLIGLVDTMLVTLSRGLGLKDDALKTAVGEEELEFLLKINYYPACPRPDLTLGVVAHTDMSALTILVSNDVPGLQVFKDDRWFDIKHIPDAIIVHIGDQIEILSNGYYKSVLHRTTVSKDRVRMSWQVFCSPPPEAIVGPLPELVGDENPPKYKSKKYKDYAHCKLNKLPQ